MAATASVLTKMKSVADTSTIETVSLSIECALIKNIPQQKPGSKPITGKYNVIPAEQVNIIHDKISRAN